MSKGLGINHKQTIIGTTLSFICTFLFQTSTANTNTFYAIHEGVSHTILSFKSELRILKGRTSSQHANFVLCEFCFWCASTLCGDMPSRICPVCSSETKTLPIQ